MRILELRPGGASSSPIELHPHLTLVQGLGAEHRAQLAAAVNAMARGDAAYAGLVEAHGVVFDLTPKSLKLLGLDADVDLVVRPGDLPGHDRDGEVAARELARAESDHESKLARLERAKGVLASVTEARASLVAAIEQSRIEDAQRAEDVVMATTALANARQERHRARSIREMVERELADARDAHQALVDSRLSTAEALLRAQARHEAASNSCTQAAAAVREAHDALAEHDQRLEQARVAAAEAGPSGDDPGRAEVPATTRTKFGNRLFKSRRNGSDGGSVAVSAPADPGPARPAASAPSIFGRPSDGSRQSPPPSGDMDAPAASPADDENVARLRSMEARRSEAGDELDRLGGPVPTQEIRAARDDLAGLGAAPRDAQADEAGKLADRWREQAEELASLGWEPEDLTGTEPEVPGARVDQDARTADTDGDDSGAAAPAADPVEPPELAAARAKLAKARKNREEAQAVVGASSTGPEEIRELEAAHTAVLDAQERTEARFGGAKAQRRLEQARADERKILDRLGFSTYADYMMSASSRFQSGPDLAVLDTADRALITARQDFVTAWRDEYGEEPSSVPCPPRGSEEPDPGAEPASPAGGDTDSDADADTETEPAGRVAELIAAQNDVQAEAETLMGRAAASDVAADLEAHSRAFGPPADAAGNVLAELLASQGIALGGEAVGRGTLIEYADAWLEEQQVVAWRRAELEAELDQIDRDVVRLHDLIATRRDQLAAAAAGEDRNRKQAAAEAATRSADAGRALAALEASGEHGRLADELQRRQAELEVRSAEEREAAEAIDNLGTPNDAPREDQLREAAERLAEAERARENAMAEEQATSAAVVDIEQKVADSTDPAAHDSAERQIRLDAVEQDRHRAEKELVVAESEVELSEHTLQAMLEAEATRRQERARNQLAKGSLLEDIDWYLLSRLASQRSVGAAGSLPLVLDDAFAELPATEGNWLLGRLERMTEAVQVILLTDRPESATWVRELGAERATVVDA